MRIEYNRALCYDRNKEFRPVHVRRKRGIRMESEITMRGELIATALLKLEALSQAQMEYFIRAVEATQHQEALSLVPTDLYPFGKSIP